MSGIIDSILPSIDGILGVRDSVGAVIRPVYMVTRTWFDDEAKTVPAGQPEGFATDLVVPLLPTPGLKDYSQDIRLREGGAVKQGDIVMRGVSRSKYAESDLDGSSDAPNVEHLYLIGDKLYRVINVTQKYVTWDVHVRELTNQERF